MGGHQSGALASGMIVDSLRTVADHIQLSALIDDVEDHLIDVNRELYLRTHASARLETIGSTVLAVVSFERWALYLWAGDSRVYRLREGALQQLSRDHSQVEEMIESGDIEAAEGDHHPLANVITRAVGGAESLCLDIDIQDLHDGDRYLLCSDGLYKMLTQPEIVEQLARGEPTEACDALVALALEHGGSDNVTVVVIHFKEKATAEADAPRNDRPAAVQADDNRSSASPSLAASLAPWTSSDKP